jgi:hypothetical protein
MKPELTVDAANIGLTTFHEPASKQFRRDGNPVFWCNGCGSYRPRHTCEWKPLVLIVLTAALVCIISLWALFSGLSVR